MDIISINSISQINYWAVVAVALTSFLLGGLWYSPAALEEAWMNANNYSEAQVAEIQASLGFVGFAGTFAAYLLMSSLLAVVAVLLNANTVGEGLMLGFIVWLGFVAPTGLTVNLFSTRPLSSWLIDSGFQLLALLIAGLIIATWR